MEITQQPIAFTVSIDSQIKEEVRRSQSVKRLPRFLQEKVLERFEKSPQDIKNHKRHLELKQLKADLTLEQQKKRIQKKLAKVHQRAEETRDRASDIHVTKLTLLQQRMAAKA